MTDQKAFSDHIDKLMFIKQLQERENLFDKFLTGKGVLPEGKGMARGGGLGSGGGLDSSGFKNRRPAIQSEMLSTTKDDDVIQAEENYVQLSGVAVEETKDDDYGEKQMVTKDKKSGNIKEIKLNGTTKSIWGETETLAIVEKSENALNKYEEKQHDPKNFHGTTSKAVIFEKDGIVSKYKSISELGKAIKMSKYQILKGFKPKKNGDSFFHEKIGAKLTFVNRSEL